MRRQRNFARVVSVVVIALSVPASPALAQDCPELVGQLPFGPASAVAVSGGRAYLASGAGLLVLDVSSPGAPVELGGVALPDEVQGVAAAGAYAYVADSWAGLRVVDVSDPAAPVEVGLYVFRECGGVVFSDGFESGDTAAWSATVP